MHLLRQRVGKWNFAPAISRRLVRRRAAGFCAEVVCKFGELVSAISDAMQSLREFSDLAMTQGKQTVARADIATIALNLVN
ncbi:hypothetical protein GGQ68_001569 [Sagittula marina]|uniref:Uncharacterized protein n=1 Tax=Sagittula marina TaxID=943940 RepID=A0A7W6DL44_9RHOB|nr:hypothetical protein [Sagittula marina]MBB3985240.1 hypothetical protein [Sagittula marina]